MPLPVKKEGENRDEFIGRCVSSIYPSEYGQREALGICYNIWEGKTNMKSQSPFDRKKDEFQNQIAIAEAKAKGIDLADYPWDECIADQTAKYGEEAAPRICGWIKANYGSGE